jgi:hypothetical protein
MATHTTTGVTHYHAQKKRRAPFIEDWRRNHRTVVALEDVTLQATARGVRTGVYVGADGDRLTRTMDATSTRSIRAVRRCATGTRGTRWYSWARAGKRCGT